MIDVWQYFEYAFDSQNASVLNILYASSSEYASVTQGSIQNDPSCSSGSQYARA